MRKFLLIVIMGGFLATTPAQAADRIVVNWQNNTSKSISKTTTPLCSNATCNSPSSIGSGSNGIITATLTGTFANIVFATERHLPGC